MPLFEAWKVTHKQAASISVKNMRNTIVYLFSSSLEKTVFLKPSNPSFYQTVFDPDFLKHIWGSVLLRQLLHAKIMEQFAPRGWEQICTNAIGWKNSIIILHKLLFSDVQLRQKFKEDGNVVLLDVVDGEIDDVRFADGILCCSHKAYQYYQQKYPLLPIFFVEQGVDPRVPEQQAFAVPEIPALAPRTEAYAAEPEEPTVSTTDTFFTLTQSDEEQAKFQVDKKNEEFQELLDKEFERLKTRETDEVRSQFEKAEEEHIAIISSTKTAFEICAILSNCDIPPTSRL